MSVAPPPPGPPPPSPANPRLAVGWGQLISLILTILASAWLGRPAPTPPPPPVVVNPPPVVTPSPPTGPTTPAIDTTALAAEVVARVNAYRSAYRLPALAVDPRLASAAQQHAAFMAQKGVMAHMGIGDGDPASRITAAGYSWSACAENIAGDFRSVDSVMAAWLGDGPHRANVVGNYQNIGVGVAIDAQGLYYWCQDFGSPTPGQPSGIIQDPRGAPRVSGVSFNR